MRSIISSDRLEEIKHEVIYMFYETGTHSLPINGFEIAQKLYYVLRPYSSLSWNDYVAASGFDPDGYSRVEFNPLSGLYEYIIYYNDQGNPRRINWTILHEIGHCYLGHHDNPDASISDIEEAEANFFAKYAIAPPVLVHQLDDVTPFAIYRHFNTTPQESSYVYDYYEKWLNHGPFEYTDYEKKTLELFKYARFELNMPAVTIGSAAPELG